MVKEGYIEKMQAYVVNRPSNNNHLHQHQPPKAATIEVEDLDLGNGNMVDYGEEAEEDEEFYDNINERLDE